MGQWLLIQTCLFIAIFAWGITDYTITTLNLRGSIKVYSTPITLKCLINHHKCEQGDFDVWSILHLIGYAIFGGFVKDEYLLTFLSSILFEYVESILGYRPRYWQDPLMNMIGYYIGNQLFSFDTAILKRIQWYALFLFIFGIILLYQARQNRKKFNIQ